MKEIFKSLKRTPYQSLATIIVLFFSSFTLTSLLFMTLFFNSLLKKVELTPQVIVYFKPETDQTTIANLKTEIGNRFKVKSIKYVSQEKALEIYKKMFKDEPILTEMVSKEMFPASLEIKVKDPKELYKIAEFAKKQKGVDEVDFQEEVVNKLLSITNSLRKFSLVAGVAIFIFTLIILISLISFKVSLKKDEIEILKLLGASNSFVFKPFILENVLIALLSSVLALVTFFAVIFYFKPFINSFFWQGEDLILQIKDYTLTIWPLNQTFILLLSFFIFFFSISSAIIATLLSANKYVK